MTPQSRSQPHPACRLRRHPGLGGTRVGAQHRDPRAEDTFLLGSGAESCPLPRASRGFGSGAGPVVSHQLDTAQREALGAALGAPRHADCCRLVCPSTATTLPRGYLCHPSTCRDLRRGRAPRGSCPCGRGQGRPAGPTEAQGALHTCRSVGGTGRPPSSPAPTGTRR